MFLAVPRALVVGLICAVVHNAIMIGGDYAGLHYALSLLISFLIVVVIGYRLHSGWTFRSAERSKASFTRYVVIASANLPSSFVGMFVFVNLIGLSVPVASPIVTVLLFGMNFMGNRWALKAGREKV
jgi:putative flippase GtrA